MKYTFFAILLSIIIGSRKTAFAQSSPLAAGTKAINEKTPNKKAVDADSFRIAARNKNAPVEVMPGFVRQDGVLLTYYSVSNEIWDKQLMQKIEFRLPNGKKLAKAVIIGISKDNCALQTLRDGKIHPVEMKAIDDGSRVQALVDFLIQQGYL